MKVRSTGNLSFILYLDILGFSQLCTTESPEKIYNIVNRLVEKGHLWENRDLGYKVIYFSDTILFYQKQELPIRQAFDDIYIIASKITTTLLSENIPVRGSITFGEFIARLNSTGDTNLFYGKALIEAVNLEKTVNWIGVCISETAINVLEKEHRQLLIKENVIKKEGDLFLLDPFIRVRNSFFLPASEYRNDYDFKDEIKAINFIKSQAIRSELEPKIVAKYQNTLKFIEALYKNEYFEIAFKLLSGFE